LRTDKPILYYPLDSWFIKTEVKDRMFDLNETINWKPKQLEKVVWKLVENANDWNLSRSRYWEFLAIMEN
jgi:isoleucyl-tRNA synthetase